MHAWQQGRQQAPRCLPLPSSVHTPWTLHSVTRAHPSRADSCRRSSSQSAAHFCNATVFIAAKLGQQYLVQARAAQRPTANVAVAALIAVTLSAR